MDCGVTMWLLFEGYTIDIIHMGNPLPLEKLKEHIWREADSFSKRYLNLVSGKISRCCKACLDIGDQHLKLLQKIQEVELQGKNRSRIPSEAVKLRNTCIKSKSHCTLLETSKHITYQTCVEGRKYIFCSMQYNLWHSSGKRM